MTVLKKFNLAGKEVGQVKVDEKLLNKTANSQMVKDYIVALRANARQWSANTKTRAEVNHSGQKPHPQKGTGRARQGYLGAPHYKGGGRVGGPRPKFDQHVHVNKKERRAAVQHLVTEKIQENRVHVMEFETLKAPKTKTVVEFLKSLGLEGRRVLFLGESSREEGKKKKKSLSAVNKYETFVKSLRNVPKLQFMLASNISGYDVIVSHDVVVMDSAVDELMGILGA